MAKKKKINGDEPITFELLTEFYHKMIKPQFDDLKNEMRKGFGQVNEKIDRNAELIELNSVKIDKVEDQLDGIKADLSDTVSRREFNQLKAKIAS